MNPMLIVHYAILALIAWAFIDALIRPGKAYEYANVMAKPIWLAILAGCFVLRADLFGLRLGFFVSFICLVVTVYYLGPVRDKLKDYQPPRRGGTGRGSW